MLRDLEEAHIFFGKLLEVFIEKRQKVSRDNEELITWTGLIRLSSWVHTSMYTNRHCEILLTGLRNRRSLSTIHRRLSLSENLREHRQSGVVRETGKLHGAFHNVLRIPEVNEIPWKIVYNNVRLTFTGIYTVNFPRFIFLPFNVSSPKKSNPAEKNKQQIHTRSYINSSLIYLAFRLILIRRIDTNFKSILN